MSVDAFDLTRQQLWEVDATNRAVKKFREDADRLDPHELPSGRRALLQTVRPVAAVLERWLEAATKSSTERRSPAWNRLLNFEAEVLAVVAVSAALRAGPVGEEQFGQTLPWYGKRVSAALRDQSDHDAWIAAGTGKNATKERADLVRMFQRANPEPDRRAWTRLCKRLEIERSIPWHASPEATTQVGEVLASALVAAAPHGPTKAGEPLPWWFQLGQAGPGPAHLRPQCLLLTDYAVEQMEDSNTRAELARPAMLPMLIPPVPWAYAQAA
ncbi:hypothetical protein ACI2KH_07075 [Roseomonas mucosa]|uniref:hypothetical protein n=1 Tax=Roseomonas mucosa TaxID=207340 RepID=UPI00384DC511